MVFDVIPWCCMVLLGLHGIGWYCIVLHVINGIASISINQNKSASCDTNYIDTV